MHTPRWALESRRVELSEGVWLCATEDSAVLDLYHRMCREHHVDDGEPFGYQVMLLVDFDKETTGEFDGPHSTISRACNTVVVCTGVSPGMCRIFLTKDDFRTPWETRILTEANAMLWATDESFPTLDSSTVERITRCWRTYRELHAGRVSNALDFFFYAWKAYYYEHACLNLAIALESLFSPESTTEVGHQIAYFASRHSGHDADERERIFRSVKSFYAQRSRLVHGADPKWEKLQETTSFMFQFCSRILRQLLLNAELATTMSDRKLRKEYLRELLFGEPRMLL